MGDIAFAIVVITLSILGYYISWRNFSRGNTALAITLLMICGFLLRIYTASDFYLHTWDERYHALVAKNMIQKPFKPMLYSNPVLAYDYTNWTGNHIWLHKQPLALWLMGLSMWIFGENEIALRIPSILFTTAGIWLTFYIGKNLLDKKTGYIAAFFFSLNGLIIELTAGRVATDHIDVCFLFFILVSVFFVLRFVREGKIIFNILAGLSMGLAILTKWLPALIVVPIWLLLVVESKKFNLKQIAFHFLILFFISAAVAIPWQVYIFKMFPTEAKWESDFNHRHLTEVLEGRTGSRYYFIKQIRINYGELIYFPLIWFMWKTFNTTQNKKHLALLAWVGIPLVVFSLAKTKMQGYMLFASPALFIITANFYVFVNNYRKKTTKNKWFYTVVLFLLIALPARYMIERVKPFDKIERNPKWAIELKALNKEQIKNGILFNYHRPIEAMFYTKLIVYPFIPDHKTILNLKKEGYTVLINITDDVPAHLQTIEELEFIKLPPK